MLPLESLTRRGASTVACLLLLCAAVRGADPPPEAAPPADNTRRTATLVRLRLPLTGSAATAFRGVAERAKLRLAEGGTAPDQRPLLVIELIAPQDDAATSDFESAFAVARFLTSNEMAAVKTVAFVPETIKGHAVLVALACEEIVMSPAAELGQAGLNEPAGRPIDPTVIAGYRQIARARLTAPEAIALGMVDPSLEVLEVETEQGIEFVTSDKLEKIEERVAVVNQRVLFPRGAMGVLSGREARNIGMAKYLADDRENLARVLSVPASQLQEADTLVADWRPIVFDIEGPITQRTMSYANRLVGAAVDRGEANWVAIRINSTGGDWTDAQQLASFVAGLADRGNDVRVVTYVPQQATGCAALVAVSSQQLVMHPTAQLGGVAEGDPELQGARLESIKRAISDSLAAETRHSAGLLTAFADSAAELFRYSNRKTGEQRLLAPADAQALEDAADWQQGEAVKPAGELLTASGDEALALGIADHTVASYDELEQLYGLTESPRPVRSTWSLEIADALASPPMQVLLLVLAFVGVYFELNTPGLGIGGFIAAVAILLFFWSKALDGTVEWLEILLFFGGVVAVMLELFVLPGIGIFGIGGGLMIVLAIILAGQRTILPSNERDWANLEQSLIVLISSVVGMIVATILLRRYLPHIPVLNSLLLAAPGAEEVADISARESTAAYSHLLGQHGLAATPLMPSGKADIDGDLIDVIAQGEAIDRGATIEVIAVRGNLVTVRQVR